MQWKTIVCAAMFAVGTAPLGTVSAALIAGNGSLSDPTASGDGRSFGAHDGYGMFFSTAGTSATLRSASVLMDASGATSKSFNARVYNFADIGNTNPAPVISASFNASFSSAGTKWFSIDFGSGTNLAASSNYFFAIEEVVQQNNSDISWAEPLASPSYSSDFGTFVQTGTIYKRSDGVLATYSSESSSTNFGFQLSTEAVPEPSSLALMGMGLASVAAAARKARQKKAAIGGGSSDASAV